MKKFLLSLLFLTTSYAGTEQLRIAIVDTGLDLNDSRFNYLLCDRGRSSIDFTGTGIKDTNGHGTHIAGLIKEYAKDSDYCLIILKYYTEREGNTTRVVQAFEYAVKHVSIVNFSGGGEELEEDERNIIRDNSQVKFIVAAGNDGRRLDGIHYCFYPACYNLPNIMVVGSLKQDGKTKSNNSNYGNRVKYWEIGDNVFSTSIKFEEYENTCSLNKIYMSGTSMATAIKTGKYIYERTH